jgi:hypothetical protein
MPRGVILTSLFSVLQCAQATRPPSSSQKHTSSSESCTQNCVFVHVFKRESTFKRHRPFARMVGKRIARLRTRSDVSSPSCAAATKVIYPATRTASRQAAHIHPRDPERMANKSYVCAQRRPCLHTSPHVRLCELLHSHLSLGPDPCATATVLAATIGGGGGRQSGGAGCGATGATGARPLLGRLALRSPRGALQGQQECNGNEAAGNFITATRSQRGQPKAIFPFASQQALLTECHPNHGHLTLHPNLTNPCLRVPQQRLHHAHADHNGAAAQPTHSLTDHYQDTSHLARFR